MAPAVKLFVKVFFGAGLPFGLIMGLIQWPGLGGIRALETGVSSGAGFGLLFATLICLVHIIARKRSGLGSETDQAASSRALDLPMDPDQVFDRVLEGLNRIDKIRITREDRQAGRIEAATGQTWKSWGEEVSADLTPAGLGRTRLVLASRSRVPATLADFGKNQENLQAVLRAFSNS